MFLLLFLLPTGDGAARLGDAAGGFFVVASTALEASLHTVTKGNQEETGEGGWGVHKIHFILKYDMLIMVKRGGGDGGGKDGRFG